MNLFTRSKKAKVTEKGDVSVFDFDHELEKEQVPSNTFKSGSTNYFMPNSYHRKGKLPVTISSRGSKREVQQSVPGKSGDENQVSTSGYNTGQRMTRSKDMASYTNEVVVNASRARLDQHYGRFMDVIFSATHIEVKRSKEILSRKWQFKDLCAMKCFFNFHSENEKSPDEKALVVLLLHKSRVFRKCPDRDCTNPSDLTQTLVMEVANDKWKAHQKHIFRLFPAYQNIWKRLDGEEMQKYKDRLSRNALEELSINGNLTRNTEPEIIPEMSSPRARANQEVLTFETLVYPLSDPDAVTVTTKDLDALRPMGFLNDTIIDFYVKYLQTKLSDKDKERFYFFNSFFFRKLVDSCKKYTGPDRGKVVYERVRKWTRKVSLFEKDYIFIPINQSLHWSLVIVCHLGSLGRSPDECTGRPCILHLDSLEGSHESIEEHIRNYILQAWKEEHQNSANDSSDAILSEMEYIEAMVPQQVNHCDCGTYLLHFVELFLKRAPQRLSLASSEGFPFLTRNWFKPSEASAKRNAIRNLLIKLHQSSQAGASDGQATPSLEQAAPSSASGDSGDANELLVIDEDDDVCESSGSEVIHSNLVATLHRQIIEETDCTGQRSGSPEAGPTTQSTPLIAVDSYEANEASQFDEDLQMLDVKDDKVYPSSSFSAHENSSHPPSSPLASVDISRVSSSAELVSSKRRTSSSPDDFQTSSFGSDDDCSENKRRS